MKFHNKLSMRTALVAAISVAALVAGHAPATANGSTRTLDLIAEVPASCVVSEFGANSELTISVGLHDGLPDTTPVSATTDVSCNTPATVRLDSDRGGILHNDVHNPITSEPGMTNFSDGFGYTAKVKLDGTVVATLETDEGTFNSEPSTGDEAVIDGTNASPNMSVDVEITPKEPASSTPLMAGTYTEALHLNISPID